MYLAQVLISDVSVDLGRADAHLLHCVLFTQLTHFGPRLTVGAFRICENAASRGEARSSPKG